MFHFEPMRVKFPVSRGSCGMKFAFPRTPSIFQPFLSQTVEDLYGLRGPRDGHFLGKERWQRNQGNTVGDHTIIR